MVKSYCAAAGVPAIKANRQARKNLISDQFWLFREWVKGNF